MRLANAESVVTAEPAPLRESKLTVVKPAYSKGAGSRGPETAGHAYKENLHNRKNLCLVGFDSTVTEVKLV